MIFSAVNGNRKRKFSCAPSKSNKRCHTASIPEEHFYFEEGISPSPIENNVPSGEWTWWLACTSEHDCSNDYGEQQRQQRVTNPIADFTNPTRENKSMFIPDITPIDEEYVLWSHCPPMSLLDKTIEFVNTTMQDNSSDVSSITASQQEQGYHNNGSASRQEECFAWEHLQEDADKIQHNQSCTNEDHFLLKSFVATSFVQEHQASAGQPSTNVSVSTDPVAFCEMSSDITALEGELQSLINEDLLHFLSCKIVETSTAR